MSNPVLKLVRVSSPLFFNCLNCYIIIIIIVVVVVIIIIIIIIIIIFILLCIIINPVPVLTFI